MDSDIQYFPLVHCWVLLKFLESQKWQRSREIGIGLSIPVGRLYENRYLERRREGRGEWRYQLLPKGYAVAQEILKEVRNFPGLDDKDLGDLDP